MILREKIESLKETIDYFPVTGIVGPRQVGKTTLAKELLHHVKKESLYIDLENPKDIAKLTDPVLFFEKNIDKCIVLDEVQRMPELFPILRSMVDLKREAARFIILGSASPELIRDSSESLAGRIAYEELAPFNLTEINGDLYKHWISGGFPDSFLAPNNKIRIKWLSNFTQTYIERDLPLLGLNTDRNTIRKLWTMVAHVNGSLLNMSNFAKSLELSSTTIKKYLSFLEDAFLIRQLHPFSANVKKRLVKSPKIFIRDSGILHHLLNIPNFETLESNSILGNSWEGYATEQIIQKIDSDTETYFYRTHEGSECDLILVKGGKPLMSIEIKYTSSPKPTKGMHIAFDDIGSEQNFIITPNTDEYQLTKNITVCNLYDFLTKHIK